MNSTHLRTALAAAVVSGLVITTPAASQDRLQRQIDTTAREPGQIESARSVMIRSELSEPATILWIVPEGTRVKKGDLLVELDSAELLEKREVAQLELAKAQAVVIEMRARLKSAEVASKASVEEHELLLELAALDRDRFLGTGGEFEIQRKSAETVVQVTSQKIQLAQRRLEHATDAAANGQGSQLQVHEAEFQLSAAQRELELAKAKKTYLTDSVKPFQTAKLELAMRQASVKLTTTRIALDRQNSEARAQLAAAEQALGIGRSRLENVEQDIARSKIQAPQDGIAIYPQQAGRRAEVVLEVGALARPRQNLVQLPDLTSLQVAVRVNETRIGRMRVGQAATVEIDAFPGRKIEGKVVSVAKYPEPTSFLNANVKEYRVVVSLEEPPRGVRIGMTALVEIRLE